MSKSKLAAGLADSDSGTADRPDDAASGPAVFFIPAFVTREAPGTAVLTDGDDVVSAGIDRVVAADGTLSGGDQINPDAGSTLELSGAGEFDLTQPVSLTNIGSVVVDAAGADVTLRSGLIAPVTLSASGGDTVTLANDGDSVDANGGADDVFNVTASQAANAVISGGPFSQLNISSADAQAVAVGPGVTGIDYIGLLAAGASLDPGASGATLVYVYDTGGGNTVLLNGTAKAALDYSTDRSVSDSYVFSRSGGDILSIASVSAPTENIYGFDATSSVVLSEYASASVSSAASSADGGPGTLVTIDGTDSGGDAIEQLIQLYGTYSGTFSVAPSTGGSGYALTYVGAAPTNVLTQRDDSISGVSDVYAAAGTITSGDVVATTKGGTIHLLGAGGYELDDGAKITGVATIDVQDQAQSVALGTQAVTVNILSAGADFIQNVTDQTVIAGGSSGGNEARTSSKYVNGLNVDLGSGGNNLLDLQDTGFTLALNAPNLADVTEIAIQRSAAIELDTGTYESTSGIAVNVNIGDDGGSTLGGDTVTLRGASESVSDFFGGNTLNLLAAGQTINADMTGQGTPSDTVTGFGASDSLQFIGLSSIALATTFNASADTTTLRVTGVSNGNTFAPSGAAFDQSFVFKGFHSGAFSSAPQDSGGFEVTYIPCYAEGTLIAVLGADGAAREAPVETLRAGDVALVRGGRTRPIVWTGNRRIDVARHPDPEAVAPIRIDVHAIAPFQPRRDLTVSPDHAVLADGVLVPARMLVNGASIRRLDARSVRYFHIELDAHDLLIAEGLPAESYLDTGNRAAFAGQAVTALHPEFSPAPRDAGMKLADAEQARRAWERVAARAGADRCEPDQSRAADAPVLVAAGRVVRPAALAPGRAAYALPRGVRSARLVSAAARPSDGRPWLDDRRMLGAAVARLEIDGQPLPLDGPALGSGWHALERDDARAWRWTDGDALVALPDGAALLTVTFASPGGAKRAAA